MYYRRKILLSLLQIFGGRLPKIDFQKYLFLLNTNKTEPFFEFIPYKYGCFSFSANQDMSTMVKYNLIGEAETYWQLKDKTNHLNTLSTSDKIQVTSLYQKYKHLSGNELMKYVYERYPYFAINSLKAKNILDEENYRTVVKSKPHRSDYTLFSIGYEGKTVEHFTNELIRNDIRVLCDIRKNALSMKYGFSKKQLKFILENSGIKYIHIPELGIESNKRQKLNSKKDYEKLFNDYEKNTLPGKSEVLEELYNLFISNKRITLMCFEADHTFCHRSRTIDALTTRFEKEYTVKHL
jgi:uncharacterized protein (DUF488 family)